MTMLDVALAYLARGVSIMPIERGTKQPPKSLRWKRYQDELPTSRTAKRWFQEDRHNVAIIMGPSSGGLANRDFDRAESYHRWAADFPTLAETLPTVETQRGYHVYFRVELTGRNVLKLADGELRLSGCYNLAPISIHPEGKRYTWRVPLADKLPTIEDFEAAGLIPEGYTTGHNKASKKCGDFQNSIACADIEATPPQPNLCLEYSLDSLPSLLHAPIELAIERTIPTREGKRHKQVFEFARELKAFPELTALDVRSLKPLVRSWHSAAKPYIQTKAFEETWLDFAEGWAKVKTPKGQEPIRAMFALAKTQIPEVAQRYETPEVRQLVALCRVLQIAAGDQPFFLASRPAGELLEVSHVQASRWLRLLCLDNVLRVAETGSVQSGKASRYRYLGDI